MRFRCIGVGVAAVRPSGCRCVVGSVRPVAGAMAAVDAAGEVDGLGPHVA